MLATRLLLLLAASPATPCGVFIDSADVQSYGEDVGSKAFQASISITRDAWKAGSTYTIDLGAAAHGPVNCWNVDLPAKLAQPSVLDAALLAAPPPALGRAIPSVAAQTVAVAASLALPPLASAMPVAAVDDLHDL